MKRTLICMTLILSMAMPAGALFAAGDGGADSSSAAMLLEKAYFAEQNKGDIDGAIALYKSILERADEQRQYIAQAHLRLGICLNKKNMPQEALKHINIVLTDFRDIKVVAKQAASLRGKISGNVSGKQLAEIVQQTVETISTLAETDPKLADAMKSLEGLNSDLMVAELLPYLDSDQNTIRRSALYIIWNNKAIKDASLAAAKILELCSHKEDTTRGMAALALGKKKLPGYDVLVKMAREEESGFARRCAAYALGMLGRPEAIPVLKKLVDTDKESLVRANAQAAIEMLERAKDTNDAPKSDPQPQPRVIRTVPQAFSDDVNPRTSRIRVSFDQTMRDGSWSFTGGGDTYPETPGKPRYDTKRRTCTLPVKLEPGKVYWVGVNSPSFWGFKSAKGVAAKRYVVLFATKGTDGKPTKIPDDLLKQAKAINDASRADAKSQPQVSQADKKKAEDISADAWRLWGARKFAEAEDKFEESVALDPANANAWNGLGWSRFNQGKRASAKEAFLKSLGADPRQVAAMNGLGWISKAEGEIDEAIDWWKQAVDILPQATAALNGLTSTLYEQRQFEEALKYYRIWLKVDPNSADAKAGMEKARKALDVGPVKTMRSKLISWVEDYFSKNCRDITARKMIEWGDPQIDADGNWSIRYKFQATIWDKDKYVFVSDFTFKPDGTYVSVEKISSEPVDKPSKSKPLDTPVSDVNKADRHKAWQVADKFIAAMVANNSSGLIDWFSPNLESSLKSEIRLSVNAFDYTEMKTVGFRADLRQARFAAGPMSVKNSGKRFYIELRLEPVFDNPFGWGVCDLSFSKYEDPGDIEKVKAFLEQSFEDAEKEQVEQRRQAIKKQREREYEAKLARYNHAKSSFESFKLHMAGMFGAMGLDDPESAAGMSSKASACLDRLVCFSDDNVVRELASVTMGSLDEIKQAIEKKDFVQAQRLVDVQKTMEAVLYESLEKALQKSYDQIIASGKEKEKKTDWKKVGEQFEAFIMLVDGIKKVTDALYYYNDAEMASAQADAADDARKRERVAREIEDARKRMAEASQMAQKAAALAGQLKNVDNSIVEEFGNICQPILIDMANAYGNVQGFKALNILTKLRELNGTMHDPVINAIYNAGR